MLVTERLIVDLDVDLATVARPGALDTIGNSLVDAVIAAADERAWKVRAESVHVWSLGMNDRIAMERFRAIWSPEEARFIGGEYDGDTITVSRDAVGLPLQVLALPYRSGSFAGPTDEMAPLTVASYPPYERVGIDPIDDVWIYKFLP